VGSTEYIVRTISSAPPGTVWGVGTEINLVTRIARENPDKVVFCLDPIICPCSTMYRVHPAYLLWVTDALVRGEVVNEILVPPRIAYWAKVALEKMLQVV
jgi:quinolinate synthase